MIFQISPPRLYSVSHADAANVIRFSAFITTTPRHARRATADFPPQLPRDCRHIVYAIQPFSQRLRHVRHDARAVHFAAATRPRRLITLMPLRLRRAYRAARDVTARARLMAMIRCEHIRDDAT